MATFKYSVKVNGKIIPSNTEVEIKNAEPESPETEKAKRSKKKAADEQ